MAGYSVPVLSSFYFHPIPSAVLEIAGGDEKGLGRSYLTDSCNGLGVPEWSGCYSAGADSCREGSGPNSFSPAVPLIWVWLLQLDICDSLLSSWQLFFCWITSAF